MKYRLLKDLPGWKAGSEFHKGSHVWYYKSEALDAASLIYEAILHAEDYPDWFEPIEDKPKWWRASEDDEYFYINHFFNPCLTSEDKLESDDRRYEAGNYFRTREQAEAVAEAIKTVLAYIHDDFEPEFDVQFKDGKWAGTQESELLTVVGKARKLVQEDR